MKKIQKTIKEAPLAAALILVILVIFSATASADTISSISSTISSMVQPSDNNTITITNVADATMPENGAKVTYVITATNVTSETSTDETILDMLPAGLVFDSATTSEGSYDPATGLWTLGNIPANGIATLIIQTTVAAPAGTMIENNAQAIDGNDRTPLDNQATATFTVANNPIATPVGMGALTIYVSGLLTENINTNLTITDLSAGTTNTITTTNGTSSFALPIGDSYAIEASAVPGYLLTSSKDCSGVVASPVTCTISFNAAADITTPIGNLNIQQSVDNTNPLPGQTVHYKITVTALGPQTSTGVKVTDLLPLGLSLVAATPSVGIYANSSGEWNIGDLPAGMTATLQIEAVIDNTMTGQVITNSATVGEASSTLNMNKSISAATAITVQNAASAISLPTGTVSVSSNDPTSQPTTTITDMIGASLQNELESLNQDIQNIESLIEGHF